MLNKYKTKKEMNTYKKRAFEIAAIFEETDNLEEKVTDMYVQYIEEKKEALFEKTLEAKREKQAERKRIAEARQKAEEHSEARTQ
jgi:hypothetical protein